MLLHINYQNMYINDHTSIVYIWCCHIYWVSLVIDVNICILYIQQHYVHIHLICSCYLVISWCRPDHLGPQFRGGLSSSWVPMMCCKWHVKPHGESMRWLVCWPWWLALRFGSNGTSPGRSTHENDSMEVNFQLYVKPYITSKHIILIVEYIKI